METTVLSHKHQEEIQVIVHKSIDMLIVIVLDKDNSDDGDDNDGDDDVDGDNDDDKYIKRANNLNIKRNGDLERHAMNT